MAIAPSSFYDMNRDTYWNDMYHSEIARYEKEMRFRRMQEEERHRMQQYAFYDTQQQQGQLANQAFKPNPKDPLSFLSKADNKLLLTGETS